jgi:nucleoside-diphosphate-sugar epimerase
LPAGEEELVSRKHALVVGASGLVGTNFLRHLSRHEDWETTSLSRRPPDAGMATRHVSLDLLDRAACIDVLASLRDITHVFYLSRAVEDRYTIKVAPNVEMLQNLLDGLDGANGRLQHVQLMHGLKWYGSHLGPFRTPAKESHPRPVIANFYYDQYDFIVERQRGKGWTWSTLRPHFVCGVAIDSPSNIMSAICAYATVLKEMGQTLSFPGPVGNFNAAFTYTSVDLLAQAMLWAATDPRCANDSFNIVNGDYFRWRDLWPNIAAQYAMEVGPVRPIKLAEFMKDKEPIWLAAVARHGLQPNRLTNVADWHFADTVFGATWDQTASGVKAHQHGFPGMVDTEMMMADIVGEYRRHRIFP